MTRPRSRRAFLGGIGAAGALGLAGCLGTDAVPTYERREVSAPAAAEPRTATELSAAAALAQTEPNEQVAPIGAVELVGHEFVYEPTYLGATVQGTAANESDSRIDLVEVRVRVYNDTGVLLGRYLATVGGLDAGRRWRFSVIILESPDDIAAYDIAALGTPV